MRQIAKFALTAVLMSLGLFYGTTARAFEGPHHVLFDQNYDSNPVGQLPAGWSGLSAFNNNAFVTNDPSVSSPNSFANQFTSSDSSYIATAISGFQYTMTNAGQWISYQFDVNVDYIGGNDSEGFGFKLWNATFSNIDAGYPRILRNGTQWRFYNGLVGQNGGSTYIGGYNFDEWHNFRVKLILDGNTGPVGTEYFGRALWYMDNALVNTETWTNRNFSQVREIDTFEISSVIGTVTGARMFIDNLQVEAIPEPTGMALMAVGGLMILFRRTK